MTPELLWLLGEKGLEIFEDLKLTAARMPGSVVYPNAGAYVLRDGDLYLHLNANDCGVNGRGSHGHNDALTIEISAFGRDFIVDPGSYVYNLDREARQIFRSTAYHSTVMVDGVEQNTTNADMPFVMGNEARPAVIEWRSSDVGDLIAAEHFGYDRLRAPVCHRRSVQFNKTDRYWIIEDELIGNGAHEVSFRFHLSPGISVDDAGRSILKLTDDAERSLIFGSVGINVTPEVIPAFVSRNYGHREPSSILKWEFKTNAPMKVQFIIVPSGPNENFESRLELTRRLADNIGI